MRISITILLVLTLTIAAFSTIHYVPSQYTTIQAAVNACSPGDTVMVDQGIYVENVLMTEGVTLIGAGMGKTIVDGGGLNDVIKAYQINNVTIEHLTAQNSEQSGSSPGNIGIFLNPISSTGTKIVRYCEARNCGKGIDIWNDFGGTAYINHNLVHDNIYDGFSPYLGTVYLYNNTICDNGRDGYNDWSGGGYIEFRNNIIANNGRYGIYKHMNTPVNIAYNDVYGNTEGNYMEGYSGPPWSFTPSPGTGEISSDALFYGGNPFDYHLTWENFPIVDPTMSPCIDSGDPSLPMDPDDTIADMGCFFFNQETFNISLELAPLNPPIIIPFGGGSFDYTIAIQNNESFAVDFDIWIKIVEYNRLVVGPLHSIMPALGSVEREKTQSVPGNVIPPGTYTFELCVGSYPQPIWTSASFPVTISGTADESLSVSSLTASPNPFNPETTLYLAIDDEGEISLKIYDILGRESAVIVDDYFLPGEYEFKFDGSNLSSGIYFARMMSEKGAKTIKLMILE